MVAICNTVELGKRNIVMKMIAQIGLGQRVYRNTDGVSERYTVISRALNYLVAKRDMYNDTITISETDLANQEITVCPLFPCYDYYIPDMADFELQ